MPDHLTIQPATNEDIPFIQQIEKASFPTQWQEKTYLGELKNPIAVFLAAKLDGRLVGFALSWIVVDEFHILKIATDPTARQQGIATELMHRSFDLAIEQESFLAHLEVRVSNIPAQNFYKKLSFRPLSVRKKYYTDTNEDAIVMVARLDQIQLEDEP